MICIFEISSKICFHALLLGWVACDRSLIFFLMSGDGGDGDDRLGVAALCGWVDVRDNLSDSILFRCMSKVCLFCCLKKSSKLLVNYKI